MNRKLGNLAVSQHANKCYLFLWNHELVCWLLKLTVLKAFGSWGFTCCPVSSDLASLKPLAGHFTDGILSILYKNHFRVGRTSTLYNTTYDFHFILKTQKICTARISKDRENCGECRAGHLDNNVTNLCILSNYYPSAIIMI